MFTLRSSRRPFNAEPSPPTALGKARRPLSTFASRSGMSLACFAAAGLVSACAATSNDQETGPEPTASAAQALDFESDWTNLHRVGGGWDSLTDDPRGDCIVLGPLLDNNPTATGNTVVWSISYTKDSNELRKALSVSASASLKAGFGSGSVKARYAESVATNHFSVYALARVNVLKSSRSMRNVFMTPGNATLVENGKLDIFRRRCGDRFVVGEQSGGELVGVFEFAADSLQKRQELEATVKASSGTWSAKGSFASSVERLVQSSSIRTTSSFVSCEDKGFGVAAYKACWHYADGTLYTGPIPPPGR